MKSVVADIVHTKSIQLCRPAHVGARDDPIVLADACMKIQMDAMRNQPAMHSHTQSVSTSCSGAYSGRFLEKPKFLILPRLFQDNTMD
jgi:hypothetical protein